MPRREEKPRIERLNLLIDPDLKDWVKRFARSRGTTITRLIVEHFESLQVADRSVEQI